MPAIQGSDYCFDCGPGESGEWGSNTVADVYLDGEPFVLAPNLQADVRELALNKAMSQGMLKVRWIREDEIRDPA